MPFLELEHVLDSEPAYNLGFRKDDAKESAIHDRGKIFHRFSVTNTLPEMCRAIRRQRMQALLLDLMIAEWIIQRSNVRTCSR